MRDITLSDLERIGGRSRAAIRRQLVDAINKHTVNYGIDTIERMAMFLAQGHQETRGFRKLVEGMSYTAGRLMDVWPTRFRSIAQARKYARQPKKLANYVYGNRLGNRGRRDAGWEYRGSGFSQTTGFTNFSRVEEITGLPVTRNPDLLRQPDAGVEAACIYWKQNKLGRFADKGDVKGCRKAVTGGCHGLKEVRAVYATALKVLNGEGRRAVASTDIRKIQTWLCHAGHRVAVDGIAGRKTGAAIKVFQKAENLAVDGIAGPQTTAALRLAAAPQPIA